MLRILRNTIPSAALLLLLVTGIPRETTGQEIRALFPDRSLMPVLLAGPRDPATSFSPVFVGPNPDAHGDGVEVDVSIGSTIPVFLLSGEDGKSPVVAGIDAAVFARFGLQVLERELIATDWVFAVPVVWQRPWGWLRFRYYHTSSHMGDEYARRFEDPGINFARDAVEAFSFYDLSDRVGVYGAVRYAYIVHPEESKRWVLRTGAQWEAPERGGSFLPFLATDLEWDQDAGGSRLEVRAGTWLPEVAGRRSMRLALLLLSGPSPLGQFNGLNSTQIGIALQGNL